MPGRQDEAPQKSLTELLMRKEVAGGGGLHGAGRGHREAKGPRQD